MVTTSLSLKLAGLIAVLVVAAFVCAQLSH
jgi:hypothetical protein